MRSACPLNFGLEQFGDKWSLLILRDMMFFDKRYYNEFLSSEEAISTNILADRLLMLEKEELITKQKDTGHKQRIRYSLTEKAIDLLPVILEIGLWSDKHAGKLITPEKAFFLVEVKKDRETGMKKITDKLRNDHIL